MELSRKEEYRNQKVLIGVTLLSFIVMLLFFIYTNVITASSTSASAFNSDEMLLEVSSGDDNSNSDNEITALATSKPANTSVKIQTVNSDVELKNSTLQIIDNYQNPNYDNTVSPENEEQTQIFKNERDLKTILKPGSAVAGGALEYDLAERTILFKPNFTHSTNEQGNVVVEIVVDKSGTVIEAIPNGRGTTTNSSHLKAEAKKIALATKFSEHQKPEEQKGTITIIFSFK